MADNTTFQAVTLATPPSGTVVAADDVAVGGTQASGLVQFMKLVDGTLNGTDPIKGDSTNGLDVDVTRLPGAATPARTSVPDNGGAVTLLAANAARQQAVIVNDSDADLYVGFGAAVTTADYTYFLPKKYGGQKSQMELPCRYTGIITGIWSSAPGGAAKVTELT